MQLKQIIQCDKCPWKTSTNPWEIPDGYSLSAHQALINTITLCVPPKVIAQKDPVEQLADINKP